MPNEGLKLYEMADSMKKLEEIIEKDDDQSLVEYLDSVQLQISEKIDNVVRYRRTMELTADAIDNEIKRLEVLKKSYERKADSLKNYLSYCLIRMGEKKMDTPIAKLSLRKSDSVVIDSEDRIPEKFIATSIVKKVDKIAIKEAIKAGEDVGGVHIETKQNLIIK